MTERKAMKCAGPWDNEPDELSWIDEATGLSCQIRRTRDIGCLCGYVQIPEGHPIQAKAEGDVESALSVHGGITFDGRWVGGDSRWVGFDCAHLGDFCPGMGHEPWEDETYRDIAYVKREIESLAKQINEWGRNEN